MPLIWRSHHLVEDVLAFSLLHILFGFRQNMLIDSEVKVEEVCDLQKEEEGNCQELWVFTHIAPVLITVDAEDKRNDQIG